MENALLFWSLFFPRFSLLIAYMTSSIPINNVPLGLEFVLTLFVPRVLMLVYVISTLGWDSGWTIAHIIFLILAWGSTGASASSSGD